MKFNRLISISKNFFLSPRGKNILVFCLFLCISTILWFVMTLNEEVQKDLRASFRITNVPDSIKRVTPLPPVVNLNVRASGTEFFTYYLGKNLTIDIDYKYYAHDNEININSAQLRGIANRIFGQSAQVLAMNPDKLNLVFTSRKPTRLPLKINARIKTLPNCSLTGPVTANVDSVLIYSVFALEPEIRSVGTAELRLDDVSKSEVVRVKVDAPAGTRAVPDSVYLNVSVEPMISRKMPVVIRPINVPSGLNLILMPKKVDVNYTIPMSSYDDSTPAFEVIADFNTLDPDFSSSRIKISLSKAKGNFLNTYLSTDSVEYIIERK